MSPSSASSMAVIMLTLALVPWICTEAAVDKVRHRPFLTQRDGYLCLMRRSTIPADELSLLTFTQFEQFRRMCLTTTQPGWAHDRIFVPADHTKLLPSHA